MVIKGGSAAGAIAAVIIGIFEYVDIRNAEINIKNLEVIQMKLEVATLDRQSKAKFLDRQFDKYVEVVSLAGRLATHTYSRTEKDAAYVRDLEIFWRLYWAELGMVEDGQVAMAMVKFGETLKKLVSGLSDEMRESAQSQLKQDALNLSHCVSKSLENNWSVKLNVGPCNR
jgi:hypothetical protein